MPSTITILDGINDGDDADSSATSFAGSPSGIAGTVTQTDTTPTTLYRSELEGIGPFQSIFVGASDSIHISSTLSLKQTAGTLDTFMAGSGGVSTDPGDAIITAGGSLIISTPGTASIGVVSTGSGNVQIAADQIDIAGLVATTGLTSLGPLTSGTSVTLGDTLAPTGLVISNAELGDLLGPAVSIGTELSGLPTAGQITIGTATVGASTLDLFSNGGVNQAANVAPLTVGNGSGTLNVTAAGNVDLGTPFVFSVLEGVDVGTVGGESTSGHFVVVKPFTASGALVVSATSAFDDLIVQNKAGGLEIDGPLSTAHGNILASTMFPLGPLDINADINAGSGAIGLLDSGADGSIVQGLSRLIIGTDMIAEAGAAIELLGTTNAISGNVDLNSGFGDISFTNSSAYTIGGLSSITYNALPGAPLALLLGPGIRTGSNHFVGLTAGGDITEASGPGDIVSTGTLGLARIGATNPNVTLDNAHNTINKLGSVDLGTGALTLVDLFGLTLDGAMHAGSVSLTAPGLGMFSTSSIDTSGGVTVDTTLGGILGGVISGAGGFTKNGAGTITLTAADLYGGTTTINGGILLVDGSIASPTTVVNNGGTLGGHGTTGAVNVASGGTLSPGASAGLLTTDSLAFVPGATFKVELGGTTAGSDYDQVHVNGVVGLDGATLDLSLINGFNPASGSCTIIDNDHVDPVLGTFAGLPEGAIITAGGVPFSISYHGGDGNDVVLTRLGPDQAPVNTVPGTQNVDQNHALAIAGLSVADADAGAGLVIATLSVADGTLTVAPVGGSVTGSGTASVILTGTVAQIDATLAAPNNVMYTPAHDFTGADTLTVTTNDNGNTGTGGPLSTTDHVTINVNPVLTGTPGNDSFAALPGIERIDALGGIDTISFNFKLTDATISWQGNKVIVDGPNSHTVLTGFEVYQFTDGTVHNDDSDPLVDDLFYYAHNHDVWNAHADADTHYHQTGWHEGRDPNAFFSTSIYLGANADVKAAGVDPLVHFDQVGWAENRFTSLNFDPKAYLAANPDVAAAHVDPLRQFLQSGEQEGRQPFAPSQFLAADGFDYVYYLQHNPDVAAAGVDPFLHFETVGWKEGRNPNALFDVKGYLANYSDVAAAGVNPLDHYHQTGWHEGRDPTVNFDTTSYLAAYPDVAAAHIDPLLHYLQSGIHEGRSAFADGVWG